MGIAIVSNVSRFDKEYPKTYKDLNRQGGIIPDSIMRQFPLTHYCNDWDGLLISDNMPELESCQCRFKADGELK